MVQVLATQWNPCHTKTSQETEKNLRKLTETVAEAKSYSYGQFIRSILKNHHGIIEQLHFINQRQAELQNELYVEQMNRHQPYCCNLDRMICGGRILWNAVAVCEMTKTSWQRGNFKMNEDLGNPSSICFVRGGIWEEDILIAEIEE